MPKMVKKIRDGNLLLLKLNIFIKDWGYICGAKVPFLLGRLTQQNHAISLNNSQKKHLLFLKQIVLKVYNKNEFSNLFFMSVLFNNAVKCFFTLFNVIAYDLNSSSP